MPGIFGYLQKETEFDTLEHMCNLLNRFNTVKTTARYQDDYIAVARVGLDFYKNNIIIDDDIVILIEGICYNFKEISDTFNLDATSFAQTILKSYKTNCLIKVLNQANGCFNIFIYNKTSKKLLLINDRWSLKPLFIHLQDGNLAFSGELKTILLLDFVDKQIDENALETFISLGHFLGSQTLFKNIKQLEPSTILEYDINTKTYNKKYYWTCREISKCNLSFDTVVDKAFELLQQAVKSCCNLELRPSVSLSGGYDSRLVYAVMKELYPDYNPYTYTFGVKNCRDFINAQKVLTIDKRKNNEFYLDKSNWFPPKAEFLFDTDCSSTLMDMHGLEFYKEYAKHTALIMSGFLGDTILGDGYLSKIGNEYINRRADKKLAQKLYGEFYKFSEYDSEFFDIENSLPFLYINRGRNLILGSELIYTSHMEVARPFFDNNIIELILSIPNEYLLDRKLYNHLVLKYYPKYFKNIGRNSNLPVYIKKDFNYRINKLKHSINKRLIKWKIKPAVIESYADYNNWLREDFMRKEITSILQNFNIPILNEQKAEYLDIYKKFLDGENKYTRKILNIISIIIYIERLKKLNEQTNTL